jgi:hypothetical protein
MPDVSGLALISAFDEKGEDVERLIKASQWEFIRFGRVVMREFQVSRQRLRKRN